jgi:hypothetical protein
MLEILRKYEISNDFTSKNFLSNIFLNIFMNGAEEKFCAETYSMCANRNAGMPEKV